MAVLNQWMQSIAQGSPFVPTITWNDTTNNIMFEVQVQVWGASSMVCLTTE
jgi:hypothetical protein